MKTSDFDYVLPEALIAQHPLAVRSESRLMKINRVSGEISHHGFRDLIDELRPNDLLVFNDTKVIPARLFGQKETGGKVECLVERILSPHKVLAHLRASKSPPINSKIRFAEKFDAIVIGRQANYYELFFESEKTVLSLLYEYGEIPLPLYIKRSPIQADHHRYQTIYAKNEGAVAAPTAGLHFDEAMFEQLSAKRIQKTYVTLHVGAGTFQPVRTESLTDHQMHYEFAQVSPETCEAIATCQQKGGRVIAVGTTVVRSLETAARSGELKSFEGETNLFIYPGFQFECVDAIFTNFHLPKSTLLMLVCAFGGYSLLIKAYQDAIQENYRFFSYGDAMFLF